MNKLSTLQKKEISEKTIQLNGQGNLTWKVLEEMLEKDYDCKPNMQMVNRVMGVNIKTESEDKSI